MLTTPVAKTIQSDFSAAILAELPHIRAYARMMTNDLARADFEVQETLKRIFFNEERMSKRADLRIQLLKILRNFLIAGERVHWRDFSTPSAIHRMLCDPFRIGHGTSETPLSVGAALARLDYEDREAVVLTAGVGLSHAESAKVSGCDAEAYTSRVSHALARFTAVLGKEPRTEEFSPALAAFAAL